LCRRAMINHILKFGPSQLHREAGRTMRQCAESAKRVESWGSHYKHGTYQAGLMQAHRYQAVFWNQAID
ncbi:MAG: hypothetical protein RL367_899, partial [Pseudomonadota bacterium]